MTPPTLAPRPWLPEACEALAREWAKRTAAADVDACAGEIERLADENRRIHEQDCVNLNPATNVMNPRAEALLGAGLGSRPSLGYPGDKYEMGLEAIERIELIAAELAAEVFGARYVELRVGSGALANLYVFMATCQPGDSVIVPDAAIGGHVTHHRAGAAGLYGLDIHPARVDAEAYSVDLEALRRQVQELRPKLITIGGSLNLLPHPVAEIRALADEVGAWLLYDAAHMSGLIAGRAWQQPLEEGAHAMTMSTYKSLGGPPGGLIVTNEADLARKLEAIAFPGLTANFDAAKTAALAMTLLDWKAKGQAYAAAMVDTAAALAEALAGADLPLFRAQGGFTRSQQFALDAATWGGGQAAAKRLREANILTCGIGLPLPAIEGDMNGLRFGTPEIVRWGMGVEHMPELAGFIARALDPGGDPTRVAPEVSAWRQGFRDLHFLR